MLWIQWYKKIDLARKDISNKLMTFGSDKQKQQNSAVQQKKVMILGRREVEVSTLLLGNDKNKVIADKVLSYF